MLWRFPKRMSAELGSLGGDHAVQVHGDAKNKKKRRSQRMAALSAWQRQGNQPTNSMHWVGRHPFPPAGTALQPTSAPVLRTSLGLVKDDSR